MYDNKLKIDSAIPEFSLKGVDDKTYNLKSFSDKEILIVIFSCNHCPYVKSFYLKDAILEVLNDKEVSVPETFSKGCTIKWK